MEGRADPAGIIIGVPGRAVDIGLLGRMLADELGAVVELAGARVAHVRDMCLVSHREHAAANQPDRGSGSGHATRAHLHCRCSCHELRVAHECGGGQVILRISPGVCRVAVVLATTGS